MMNKREMKWRIPSDITKLCHNCGSKMEDIDHYCKTCGAGRGILCDYVGIYGYKKNLQMYSVKAFCNKCNLAFSNIQAETESICCPRCGNQLEPKIVSISRQK